MAIKLNPKERAVRQTECDWEYEEDGEIKTEKIRVLYYSPTVADMKADKAEMDARLKEDPDAIIWNSEFLVKRLHSLPDLVDEKDKPHPITVELLDSFTTKNLKAIKDAVDGAIAPKEQPAT